MTLPPSLCPGFNSNRFLVNPLGGSEMGVLQTTSSISEQSENDGLRGGSLTESGWDLSPITTLSGFYPGPRSNETIGGD